jgi:HEAT repeat protein
MSKQAFDKKIEALEALRSDTASAAPGDRVRKALRDRNNYIVSKAATLAGDLGLSELIPDLLSAFDRFLIDPVKSDPQCWAKNAIAKALKDLGHHDAGVYLRGIAHVQLEPVWGGRADSAATLRGTCALALVHCPLDDLEILTHLTDALADSEKTVRTDAASAISQLACPEGAMLLRLKSLLGDTEPEVIGACFASLLNLTPKDSAPFIGRFLKARNEDVRIEAAAALAQSREPEAIEILKTSWRDRLSHETRTALIASLGASPLPQAAEFLLSIIANESSELAASAVAALAVSRFHAEVRDQMLDIIEGKADPNLKRILEQPFTGPEDV